MSDTKTQDLTALTTVVDGDILHIVDVSDTSQSSDGTDKRITKSNLVTDLAPSDITGLTSSVAELNILDGVTSTAAELNILDGVTSTAAELNILDGATLTVTELNFVDGVTSAIQTQMDLKAPLASPTFTGTATTPALQVTALAYFDAEVDDGNSSTADTIDWTTGNKHKSTMTGNCTYTFTAPTGPCNIILKLVQDGTGSRLATWPGTVKWPASTAPTLTTAAAGIDIISFYYDGTNYYGQSALAFG